MARGRWKSYQRGLNRNIQPAQKGEVGRERLGLFRGLKKAESSATVQLRSGKIGFNYFLSRIRVPGVLGLECQCGWRKQDGKHITLFCLDYTEGRTEMLREAGTGCFDTIISTKEGVRAAAR